MAVCVFLYGAYRRSTRRGLPHNFLTCSRLLDVDVHLFDHGFLGWNRTGIQQPSISHDGVGLGAHRCHVHFSFLMDRRFVGQADVGNLVGLGRTPDVRTDPFLLVYGLYCAAVSSRRASACRQGWRRACTRWRGAPTDYLLFGSMVENLSSRGLDRKRVG